MYLKALEIQGFKSFPDKTVLTFGEDITAIVGPNGSGKSNISDAIRWVMGEQSTRALRGGKMEDVIFGGTAQRRQTGYAEVSLILDNTSHIFPMDESEVMVTRRYYRSGESEYYINRRSVRLKDVNELFMDTGLGREGNPSSARARSTRSSPSRAPTAGRSLRRPPASPATATGRRRQSGSWPIRTRTWSGSTTRSPSWSSRWSPCGSRVSGPESSWCCGTS